MAGVRDSFCSRCGTAFAPPLAYPRRCAACGVEVWANPVPVAVMLVPVIDGARTGLLVVRRAIEPRSGMVALVGGFVEEHERWQEAGAREVREEVGVALDLPTVEPFWFVSTAPWPSRVLLFGTAAPVERAALAAQPFVENREASGRGVVFGPDGLDALFAFELHVRAAERWFAARGVRGAHDFTAV